MSISTMKAEVRSLKKKLEREQRAREEMRNHFMGLVEKLMDEIQKVKGRATVLEERVGVPITGNKEKEEEQVIGEGISVMKGSSSSPVVFCAAGMSDDGMADSWRSEQFIPDHDASPHRQAPAGIERVPPFACGGGYSQSVDKWIESTVSNRPASPVYSSCSSAQGIRVKTEPLTTNKVHATTAHAKDPELPWECICGREYGSPQKCARHAKYLNTPMNHVCLSCDKGFRSAYRLNLHMKNKHEPKRAPTQPKKGRKRKAGGKDDGHTQKKPRPCCFCRKTEEGPMIDCGYEKCLFERFHYKCVRLTAPPTGAVWYCPECRTEAMASLDLEGEEGSDSNLN